LEEEESLGPFVWPCYDVDELNGTTIRHAHPVTAVSFTNDGRYFATGDTHGRIELRNGDTGGRVSEDVHGKLSEQDMRAGFFQVSTHAPDYDPEGSAVDNMLKATNPWVVSLAFAFDNSILAVCLLNKTILIPLECPVATAVLQKADRPLVEIPWTHYDFRSAPTRMSRKKSWKSVRHHAANAAVSSEAIHGCLSMDFSHGNGQFEKSHILATAGLNGQIVFHEVSCPKTDSTFSSKSTYVLNVIRVEPDGGPSIVSGEDDTPHVNMVKFCPNNVELQIAAASGDGNCYLYWLVSDSGAGTARQGRSHSLKDEVTVRIFASFLFQRQYNDPFVLCVLRRV